MTDTGRLSTADRIVPSRITAAFNRHDVTGFGLVVEMQLGLTSLKLPQHTLDSPLDRRIVRAVASNEFLDYGP